MRCEAPPAATVALRYGAKEVVVDDLLSQPDPNLVDLCDEHLDRLTPPIGWTVQDRRSIPAVAPS